MREVARIMLPQARSRGYINRQFLMLSAALIAGICPWARTRREDASRKYRDKVEEQVRLYAQR